MKQRRWKAAIVLCIKKKGRAMQSARSSQFIFSDSANAAYLDQRCVCVFLQRFLYRFHLWLLHAGRIFAFS